MATENKRDFSEDQIRRMRDGQIGLQSAVYAQLLDSQFCQYNIFVQIFE